MKRHIRWGLRHRGRYRPFGKIKAGSPINLPCRTRLARDLKIKRLEILKLCVIEPATKPRSPPVILAPKKDGTYNFYVDYRRINELQWLVPPHCQECTNLSTVCAMRNTCPHFNWSYWRIPVKRSDRYKTTFVFHLGTNQFNIMPCGLINSPATYKIAWYIVLALYKWQTCLVNLDDIIVFSKDAYSNLKQDGKKPAALHSSNITV